MYTHRSRCLTTWTGSGFRGWRVCCTRASPRSPTAALLAPQLVTRHGPLRVLAYGFSTASASVWSFHSPGHPPKRQLTAMSRAVSRGRGSPAKELPQGGSLRDNVDTSVTIETAILSRPPLSGYDLDQPPRTQEHQTLERVMLLHGRRSAATTGTSHSLECSHPGASHTIACDALDATAPRGPRPHRARL